MKRNDIRDETIGNLTWHEQHECWGGFIDVGGRSIPLTVMPSAQREPPIEFIRSLLAVFREDDGRFPKSAADDLLDPYNQDWRFYTSDEVNISLETFVTRLSLKMLQIEFMTLHPAGQQGWRAVVRYDASNMFTEHDVVVCVQENLSVVGVGLD